MAIHEVGGAKCDHVNRCDKTVRYIEGAWLTNCFHKIDQKKKVLLP